MSPLIIIYITVILIVSGLWLRDIYRERQGK